MSSLLVLVLLVLGYAYASSAEPRLPKHNVGVAFKQHLQGGAPWGDEDICDLRTDVPFAHVPPCGDGNGAILKDFKVSDAPVDTPALQQTVVKICHSESGFKIVTVANDTNIFSPYTTCNSQVWVNSDVLEVFLGPVVSPFDNPKWYHETDTSASGAVWAGHINKPKLGNWSNCDGGIGCQPGPLPCSGLDSFTGLPGLHAQVTNMTGSWKNELTIPFNLFPEKYRSSKIFRGNFYRYDYPNGDRTTFELSGWSPTHNPSFHVPARFGVLVLV